MSDTLQINTKAKPGQGPNGFYGNNLERAQAVRAKIEDSGIESKLNLRAMYQFTEIYLKHAADLAKSGQKDAARNWVRFFENSRVLEVLADSAFDVSKLRANLSDLSGQCHPMDVPSWETDIQAIRATLNEILWHVVHQSTEVDASANLGRYPTGQDGHQNNFEGQGNSRQGLS